MAPKRNKTFFPSRFLFKEIEESFADTKIIEIQKKKKDFIKVNC